MVEIAVRRVVVVNIAVGVAEDERTTHKVVAAPWQVPEVVAHK